MFFAPATKEFRLVECGTVYEVTRESTRRYKGRGFLAEFVIHRQNGSYVGRIVSETASLASNASKLRAVIRSIEHPYRAH